MITVRNPWLLAAAVAAFTGLALGGYGWHGLAADDGARALFQMGVQYQMWHALALVGVAWLAENRHGRARAWVRGAGGLFSAGIVLFSGSLYWLGATGAVPVAGAAPAGGLALMGGWICVAAAAVLGD